MGKSEVSSCLLPLLGYYGKIAGFDLEIPASIIVNSLISSMGNL
jgi:hypothetical protein